MKTVYPDSVIGQFNYESEEWGRLLSFLKQENAFCKARLAEMVDVIEDDAVLMIAERFNDEFLSVDRMIDFLTEELKKHRTLLQKDWYLDEGLLRELIKNQEKLRTDIQKAEEIFSTTKTSFAIYLAGPI